MAAVAGSKGRILISEQNRHAASFQAALAGRLLDGEITAHQVVQALTTAAQLREVGVDTNMICNLACTYCYLDDRPEAKGLISSDEWNGHLRPLIDAGCKLVAFIGKEPLADTIALDTINGLNAYRTRGKNFRVGMVTNGTFIDRRVNRLVDAKLDYLDVSLDSLADINDQMRGQGVFKRVTDNLKLYLETAPVHDFSITSVLHKSSARSYVDFVDFLFSIGIKTAFGSPILRFTEQNTAASSALSVSELVQLFESLAAYLEQLPATAREERQVIIDLPYKYSWLFLAAENVDWADIKQDAYEAHYVQPHAHLPLFVKFNFFPMSYWRAVRVTHDARVIENMDLAAHRLYDQHTRPCADQTGRWYFGERQDYHTLFLLDFVQQHADLPRISNDLYDREVAEQFHHLTRNLRHQAESAVQANWA